MAAPSDTLELTGLLTTPDKFGRLCLCLVEVLEDPGGAINDRSWARLRAAVPPTAAHGVPYDFPLGGAPDDIGIRGVCWATLPPAKSAPARARRGRILALAEDLLGREVVLTVRPKRFSFVSAKGRNFGEAVSGTTIQFVGLEARTPTPRG